MKNTGLRIFFLIDDLPRWLLVGLLSLAFLGTIAFGEDVQSQLNQLLPPGSRFERPAQRAQLGAKPSDQFVLWYTASSKGIPNIETSHVAVAERKGNNYRKIWDLDCHGAYTGFQPDSGVYDVNHAGTPKIVVDCVATTVCPNSFGIFEYRDGGIHAVPADFTPMKTCLASLKDLDGDGVPEIEIIFEHMNSLPKFYHWNGQKYELANSRYAELYQSYIDDYLKIMFSPDLVFSSDYRVTLCRLVVEAFRYQNRTKQAIEFLQRSLPVFDDPRRTNPIPLNLDPSKRTQAEIRRKETIESDKEKIQQMIDELSKI